MSSLPVYPQQITVVFATRRCGGEPSDTYPNPEYFLTVPFPTSKLNPGVQLGNMTISDTCLALFMPNTDTPTNLDQLQSLTNQVAIDIATWFQKQFDKEYFDIISPSQNALFDSVVWDYNDEIACTRFWTQFQWQMFQEAGHQVHGWSFFTVEAGITTPSGVCKDPDIFHPSTKTPFIEMFGPPSAMPNPYTPELYGVGGIPFCQTAQGSITASLEFNVWLLSLEDGRLVMRFEEEAQYVCTGARYTCCVAAFVTYRSCAGGGPLGSCPDNPVGVGFTTPFVIGATITIRNGTFVSTETTQSDGYAIFQIPDPKLTYDYTVTWSGQSVNSTWTPGACGVNFDPHKMICQRNAVFGAGQLAEVYLFCITSICDRQPLAEAKVNVTGPGGVNSTQTTGSDGLTRPGFLIPTQPTDSILTFNFTVSRDRFTIIGGIIKTGAVLDIEVTSPPGYPYGPCELIPDADHACICYGVPPGGERPVTCHIPARKVLTLIDSILGDVTLEWATVAPWPLAGFPNPLPGLGYGWFGSTVGEGGQCACSGGGGMVYYWLIPFANCGNFPLNCCGLHIVYSNCAPMDWAYRSNEMFWCCAGLAFVCAPLYPGETICCIGNTPIPPPFPGYPYWGGGYNCPGGDAWNVECGGTGESCSPVGGPSELVLVEPSTCPEDPEFIMIWQKPGHKCTLCTVYSIFPGVPPIIVNCGSADAWSNEPTTYLLMEQ
jgi:hypothetical protein